MREGTLVTRTAAFLATFCCAFLMSAQQAPAPNPTTSNAAASAAKQEPWTYNLVVDGYIIPDEQGYASPTLSANRGWLHLEARYNYENLRTGSLWFGYNFNFGKKVQFSLTPMVGGVFGRTTGIAPGAEASISYRKIQLSIANEYVFDTGDKSGSFYYAWPEFTYSPIKWLHVGAVAQHTKAYHTTLDVQRGFLVGVSHKSFEFTTYVFNLGWTSPTTVLEVGYSF